MEIICSVEELERTVGSRPLPPMLKSIDFLDAHAAALLALSPAAAVGYVDDRGRARATVVGNGPGFATVESAKLLRIPLPGDAAGGTGFSSLFLIPGWRETFRINGRVTDTDAGRVEVGEAFIHCAKAIIRSNLWGDHPIATASTGIEATSGLDDPRVRRFLDAAPFAVLISEDASGAADASPKGDPPGFIHTLDTTTVAIPDRPGNRRTDTMHNLMDRPDLAMIALVPGAGEALELSGTAHVTSDPPLLRSMAVKGKTPKAALVLEVAHCRLATSPTLASGSLWDANRHVPAEQLPNSPAIWTDHVKLNKTKGLAARALRAGTSKAVLKTAVRVDYRQNLY